MSYLSYVPSIIRRRCPPPLRLTTMMMTRLLLSTAHLPHGASTQDDVEWARSRIAANSTSLPFSHPHPTLPHKIPIKAPPITITLMPSRSDPPPLSSRVGVAYLERTYLSPSSDSDDEQGAHVMPWEREGAGGPLWDWSVRNNMLPAQRWCIRIGLSKTCSRSYHPASIRSSRRLTRWVLSVGC